MVITIHWPLVLFTVCACWCAGLFAIQGIWGMTSITPRSQRTALLVTVVSAAITALMGVYASDGWKDLFGGEGSLATGIDLVGLALVALFLTAVVYFIVLHKKKGNVPFAMSVAAIVVSVGLLLAVFRFYSLAAGTEWDSPLWTLVLIGQAAALGAGAMGAITVFHRELIRNMNDKIILPATLLNCVTSLLFLGAITVNKGFRTQADSGAFGGGEVTSAVATDAGDVISHAILPFDQELIFVTIVVLLGVVLSALAALLAKKNNTWVVGVWLVAALVLLGTFAMGFVSYIVVISGTMF